MLDPASYSTPISDLNSPTTHLSSPFTDKLSFNPPSSSPPSPPFENQLQLDDVFSSDPIVPPSAHTPPLSPLLDGGEIERIRQQMIRNKIAHFHESETRRPDYLKRSKRPLSESDPLANDGRQAQNGERTLPGVGITESPNKGRRLKLFQETSEESFEESLMAGGYGRFVGARTADWLEHPQPTPGLAGPSNVIPMLERATAPSPRELKKMKRLAAFRDPTTPPATSSKLYPVELEGKGRVLLDVSVAEHGLTKETPPPTTKRRANQRSKKSANADSSKDTGNPNERAELDRPNWPDSEFPWRFRLEERAQLAKAEEADRLKWIEKFFDRDSDQEDEDEEEEDDSPTTVSRHDDLQITSRKGRGKMVPFVTNPMDSPARRESTFFPSDPADARTALMSKKFVRSRQARWGDSRKEDEETLCICNGRDDGRELVQCDGCQTWFHLECIGIGSVAELGREEDPWYCSKCPPALTRTSSPDTDIPQSQSQSHEPAFARMEDELTTTPHQHHNQHQQHPSFDLPFFRPVLHDSLMTTWNSRPPSTPTRGGQPGDEFSSGSTWNESRVGPSTPHHLLPTHVARVYSTPGPFDSFGDEDSPFDPTSTPSRGIKFGPSVATPKNNMWPFRTTNALFQTPSKPNGGGTGRVATTSRALSGAAVPPPAAAAAPPAPGGQFPPLSAGDESGSGGAFGEYRNLQMYDDSPIRRTKSGGEGVMRLVGAVPKRGGVPSSPTRLSSASHAGLETPDIAPLPYFRLPPPREQESPVPAPALAPVPNTGSFLVARTSTPSSLNRELNDIGNG